MASNPYPVRKKIRLDPTAYADTAAICSVTIATHDRVTIFQNEALARSCVDLLTARAESDGIPVYAYCFMPDHLHILLSPSQRASIVDFVREFKSLSTRLAWENGHQGRMWQARYYDHFLRRDEDLRRAVEYIVGNPVRKGIVSEWREYPYCGSMVYDI